MKPHSKDVYRYFQNKTLITFSFVIFKRMETNCGIPKKVPASIFEPFFTPKHLGEKTGLGLYICYHIIMRHNKQIASESKENKITDFKIFLS